MGSERTSGVKEIEEQVLAELTERLARTPSILIIEPSLALQHQICHVLCGAREDGWAIEKVASARAALSGSFGDPLLVYVSLSLPDGVGLAVRLAGKHREAIVIACNSLTEPARSEELYRAGVLVWSVDRVLERLPVLALWILADRGNLLQMAARAETARRIAAVLGSNVARRAGYSPPGNGVLVTVEDAMVRLAREAMEQAEGNVALAARMLGVSRPRMYRLLEAARAGDLSDKV